MTLFLVSSIHGRVADQGHPFNMLRVALCNLHACNMSSSMANSSSLVDCSNISGRWGAGAGPADWLAWTSRLYKSGVSPLFPNQLAPLRGKLTWRSSEMDRKTIWWHMLPVAVLLLLLLLLLCCCVAVVVAAAVALGDSVLTSFPLSCLKVSVYITKRGSLVEFGFYWWCAAFANGSPTYIEFDFLSYSS